jgi:peptide/nickel transport system substrate-binding protein
VTKFRERSKVLAVLAAAAVLAACSTVTGGGDSGGTPAKGGELTVAGTYPIESLDPHSLTSSASTGTQLAAKAIFSRLVGTDDDGKVVGDLATKWKPGADASEWHFDLKPGLKFSDGSPLGADDVVDSFNRMMTINGANAANFTGDTMTAKSDTEVVMKAPKPDASIPGKLTMFYVIPSGVQPGDTAFFEHPVGSGPFTVGRYTPGEVLELVRNDKFAGEPAKLDKVVVRTIPELASRLTSLRTGEADVVWGIPDDQLPALQSDSSLTVKTVPSTAVFTMWFNSSIPALSKPAVRRALWQAVDFAKITKELYPETGKLADSPVAPNVLGHVSQDPVKHDPTAAKKALQNNGFDFNQKLRLQFANAEFRPFIQAVASDLAEIGVQADVLEKEQAVFTKDLLALNWDINFQQLTTPTFDAASNLGRLYPCAAKRNGYCNPDLDTLLASAGAASDQKERVDLYGQASKIIWRDAVGMYPVSVGIAYAWNNKLEGFHPDPSGLPDFATAAFAGS